MKPIVSAREFDLCTSMSDFVIWPTDDADSFVANSDLHAAFHALGLNIDPRKLYLQYFNETPIGSGETHIYWGASQECVLSVNFHREETEQLDLVAFSIRSDERSLQQVREYLLRFFNQASCQIAFQQLSFSTRLRSSLDAHSQPSLIESSSRSDT